MPTTDKKIVGREYLLVASSTCFLALNAGFVNAIIWADIFQIGVAHQTGNATNLARTITTQDFARMQIILTVMGSFLFGAMASGFIVGDSVLSIRNVYGRALIVESFALFISGFLLTQNFIWGAVFGAFAMGMQNALANTYNGLILRTTHVTGTFTEIGVIIGHLVHDRDTTKLWKLGIYVPLLFSFIIGSLIASAIFASLGDQAMYIPASFCFVAGVCKTLLDFFKGGQPEEALVDNDNVAVNNILDVK